MELNPYVAPGAKPGEREDKRGVLHLWHAFAAWVVTIAIATVISAATGEYHSLMSAAVTSTGIPESSPRHDSMVSAFIAISLAFALAMIAIGAFLVWQTNRLTAWARYVLSLFCSYQLFESYQTYAAATTQYGFPMHWYDWFLGMVSLMLLFYIAIGPHVPRLRRGEA